MRFNAGARGGAAGGAALRRASRSAAGASRPAWLRPHHPTLESRFPGGADARPACLSEEQALGNRKGCRGEVGLHWWSLARECKDRAHGHLFLTQSKGKLRLELEQ